MNVKQLNNKKFSEKITYEKRLTIERQYRTCHTVRERCLTFMDILRKKYNFTNEVPLDVAKDIFQKEMDFWDRLTLKAYFGTREGKSRRKIIRTAFYPRTGTVSYKAITLDQDIPHKEGYLEKLNMVSFEKRGSNIWFMMFNNMSETVIPEMVKVPVNPTNSVYESSYSQNAINNLSLTPKDFIIPKGRGGGKFSGHPSAPNGEGEIVSSSVIGREINSIYTKMSKTPQTPNSSTELSREEQAILNAKPSELNETGFVENLPKAHIDWGPKVSFKPRFEEQKAEERP